MARQVEGPRSPGAVRVQSVLVVGAAVVLAVLVSLALVSWFGRLS